MLMLVEDDFYEKDRDFIENAVASELFELAKVDMLTIVPMLGVERDFAVVLPGGVLLRLTIDGNNVFSFKAYLKRQVFSGGFSYCSEGYASVIYTAIGRALDEGIERYRKGR